MSSDTIIAKSKNFFSYVKETIINSDVAKDKTFLEAFTQITCSINNGIFFLYYFSQSVNYAIINK